MGTKPKLTKTIKVRVSDFEFNRIKELARKYANGNMSLWMVYNSINTDRKYLKYNNLKKSNRRCAQDDCSISHEDVKP